VGEVEPAPRTTIPALLRDAARRYGELEAVVDGDVRLDFGTLSAEALRVARALQSVGVGRGDRVAIWASNGWRWVVAACGVWQIGAVLVPLATRWKAPEVGPLLARTDARLLFAEHEAVKERLLASLVARYGSSGAGRPIAGLPDLERIVSLDDAGAESALGAGAESALGAGAESALGEAWDDFVARGDGGPALDDSGVPADALAEILFTSGTTGAPKGVELCQGQILRAYWDWSGIGGLREGDRFLVIPPYSHGFGINAGILACLMRGAANVPFAVFEPRAVLERIERERISVISGPPTLFATLMNLEDFAPEAVASLRLAFVGAAAVPSELIQAMRQRMGIERVCNAYGLIEACVISMTRADDPPEVIATTTGRAMPGVEVRIVGADGTDVPDGEPGEVWARSQGVMRGYWRDPEQTAATLTPDGWCRTGDVGVRDAAGHIRVVDRLKDAYNCGGFSAFPAEIENRLLERPEIAQVAVVGVPDARLGEVGHAFVIPAASRRVDEREILAWARENMANYKAPRRVHVVDALPLNANGKVRKDLLRERARAASGDPPP
jgi:acyl-CoA synthetase (AMP-forming)/AMP-acid ligase II